MNRQLHRIEFYRGEFSGVEISFFNATYTGQVYDLSELGIGIITDKDIQGLEFEGQPIEIRFMRHGGTTRSGTIRSVSLVKFSGQIKTKLGIELNEYNHEVYDESTIVPSHKMFCPLASCDDAVLFRRNILFQVGAFTANSVLLLTEDVDQTFFEGLIVDIDILIPSKGEYQIVVEMAQIVHENSRIEIWARYVKASDEYLAAVSEYLLTTAESTSIKRLRELGFFVHTIEKALIFRNMSRPEDFAKILKLRLLASQSVGRWVGEENIEVMRDSIDKYSRHIACSIGGETVASARVVFNNGIESRCEHLSYKVEIPDWLWQAGFVECSRVCTHPDYRGSELFIHVLRHITKIIVQSGYRYLVINCVDSLVPIYHRVGAKSLGKRFNTPYMQDAYLNLLYIDVRKSTLGIDFNTPTWAILAPISAYLTKQGQLAPKWYERILQILLGIRNLLALVIYRRKLRESAKTGIKKRADDAKVRDKGRALISENEDNLGKIEEENGKSKQKAA